MSASSNIPTSPMVESVRPGGRLSPAKIEWPGSHRHDLRPRLPIWTRCLYLFGLRDLVVTVIADKNAALAIYVETDSLLVGRSQSDESENSTEAKT
jgi:hypothetical protein